MKQKYRKFRKWFHQYINGTKGVISIMLALMMTPLLSVALVLVESARYQSAVEELEEVFDSAGLSTLANYDSYLEERFGVLAMDQKNSITDIYSGYVEKNKNLLGNNVTIQSSNANGDFSLGDTDILKQQLLEYSEIMVPAQALIDNLDAEDMLTKILRELDDGIQEVSKDMEVASAVAKIAEDFEKFLTTIKEATDQFTELENKHAEYVTAGNAFVDAAYAVVTTIQEEERKIAESEAQQTETEQESTEQESTEQESTEQESTEQETTEPVDIYETESVKNAIKEAEIKRDDYVTKITSFSSELQSFSGKMSSTIAYVEQFANDVDQLKLKLNKKDGIPEDNNTFWIMEKVSIVGAIIKETIGDNYDEVVNADAQRLDQLKTVVSAFRGKDLTSSVTKSEIESKYGPITVNSYSNFENLCTKLVNELLGNQSEEEKTSFLSVLSGMMDMFDSFLSLNLLYDPALHASVPKASLYDKTVKAELYGSALMTSINSLSSAFHNIYEVFSQDDELSTDASLLQKISHAVSEFFQKVTKLVKAIKDLFIAVAAFLGAVITYIGDWIVGIGTLAANYTQLANNFILAGYAAYDLPCRTNYASSKTLSGYSFNKIFKNLAGGSTTHALSGSLKEWTGSGSLSSSHDLFYGAELEYIAIGTNDEISNQASAFLALYVMRLLLDYKPVSSNEWVLMEEGLGNALTMGTAGTVFKYLMVLLEPLLDTILLVNGGSVYLIKDMIYVEPAGIASYLSALTKLTNVPDPLQRKLSSSINEYERLQRTLAGGTNVNTRDNGKFKFNYQETMMYLCLFTVDQNTLLRRIQNVIQMEAKYNYRNQYDFNLGDAFTYIRSEVNANLNPMLKFDRLGENGPYPIKRTQCTGY